MAEFIVLANQKLIVTSTRDAAYNQRFFVERRDQSDLTKWWHMGKHMYMALESDEFLSVAFETTWRIKCQNDQGNGAWTGSRESISGIGTPNIRINCDDDTAGDNDFNDLVVNVSLVSSLELAEETGSGPNGKFTIDKPGKNIDPPPGKGMQPHSIGRNETK